MFCQPEEVAAILLILEVWPASQLVLFGMVDVETDWLQPSRDIRHVVVRAVLAPQPECVLLIPW